MSAPSTAPAIAPAYSCQDCNDRASVSPFSARTRKIPSVQVTKMHTDSAIAMSAPAMSFPEKARRKPTPVRVRSIEE